MARPRVRMCGRVCVPSTLNDAEGEPRPAVSDGPCDGFTSTVPCLGAGAALRLGPARGLFVLDAAQSDECNTQKPWCEPEKPASAEQPEERVVRGRMDGPERSLIRGILSCCERVAS